MQINRRESSALINSLSAGVVPRIGLRNIAVGRQKEVNAFLSDLQTVEEGGGAFRFVCGRYGSGKSFLLQMIRTNAMERNFIVMDADLSPERRLTGTHKQGLATYRELMQHMATRMRPEGGALESVLQRWISGIQASVAQSTGLAVDSDAFANEVGSQIYTTLLGLSELTCGFAFANVVRCYWQAMRTANSELKQACLKWLRGEYNTKTEAKKDLPVDLIIDDSNWYEFLKLFARFAVMTGYKGLIIFLDEGVNLYKINHKAARESNYEKVLTIFNDTMQGKASNIGFFMSGTPQFVYDERRGLFSYEALKSRLSLNRFAQGDFVDYTGPVITLQQLTPEELYLLLERLADLHATHYGYEMKLQPEQIAAFLNMCITQMGADELLTPREIIRDFLGLLNVLLQDPNASFEKMVKPGSTLLKGAKADPDALSSAKNDAFEDFEL